MIDIKKYEQELKNQELAQSTIDKYIFDLNQLKEYLMTNNKELNKDSLIGYKEWLMNKYDANSTVDSKITSINKYLKMENKNDLALKNLKHQKRELENTMTQVDFDRLLRIAERHNQTRDAIILKTMYYTGIRVSELSNVTLEAVKRGYMDINNKGKYRRVPITKKLSKELLSFAKENNINQGAIILSNRGKPISRTTIFRNLKKLAGQARVKKDRVYPHSIRHLFAKKWLEVNNNNITQLADILGHGSLETTRIYTTLSTDEARETIKF